MRRHTIQLGGQVANERGAALVTALVLMLAMLTLTIALLTTGTDEVQIAQNHYAATQALQLAEAGLEVAYTQLRTNPAMIGGAPGSLTTLAVATATATAYTGTYNVQYRRGADPNSVLLVSTGTQTGGSTRTIRSTMTTNFASDEAILVDGSLKLRGQLELRGSCGGAHSNKDVDAVLDTGAIDQALTSTGDYSVSNPASAGPGSGGRKPPKQVPVINPLKFLDQVKTDIANGILSANHLFQFMANGQVLDGNGNVLTTLDNRQSYNGFTYTPGNKQLSKPAEWKIETLTNHVTGVYYFEGNTFLHFTEPSLTMNTTLLVQNDLTVHGKVTLNNVMKDVTMVAGGDLEINLSKLGLLSDVNPDDSVLASGLIASHGQMRIGGHTSLTGYVVSEGADPLGGLLRKEAYFDNHVTITHNCNGLRTPLQGALRIGTWGL